ncbi:hypothetical protein RHMOL_Rhmol10G0059200 [Rhododendron molle]|nr:hypothetical protein RHMOL_Rhmol10G0059200 [Rhododendron molle]
MVKAPEGGDSVGKPAVLHGGQNKHPDFRRASSRSYGDGSNLRRYDVGNSSTPNYGQNVLPSRFRASTGSLHDVASSGRNSTGNPSSLNSREGVIPHYLRASTGSCHDFCKYGRKHAVEVKPRSSFPKRIITTPSDRQSPAESGVPAERTTKKVVKPKPSTVSKTVYSDSSYIPRHKVSSTSTEVGVSSTQASSNEKQNNFLAKRNPSAKPKTMKVKPLYAPDAAGSLNGGRERETKIGKKIGSSKAVLKKVLESPAASLFPKPSLNRTASLTVENSRSLRILCPPKDQKRIRKPEVKQPNNEKVPEKTLNATKVETLNKALESEQSGGTIHSPPSPVLPLQKLLSLPKSPPTSFHDDEAQEEFEITDSTIHFPPPQSLSSPKLSFLPKSPSTSVHEDEAQEEFEKTDCTIHSPPLQSLSSPKLSPLPKSPSLSCHEDEAHDKLEYTDSTTHSRSPQSLSSPKLSSLPKSPSLSFHEDEAQEEFEITDSTVHSPQPHSLASPKISSFPQSPSLSCRKGEAQEELECTDITIHSSPPQWLSSPKHSSLPNSPSLSFHEDEAQEGFEVTDCTIHSPPPPCLSSPKLSSLPQSPSSSFQDGEAQEEFEYADNTIHSLPPQPLSLPILPSLPKPPSLSSHEDEAQDLECTDSAVLSPLPQSLSSPRFSSLPKSPSLSFHEDEAHGEFEYTDSEADEYDDSISESSDIMDLHDAETLDGNLNRVPKKAGIGLSEDKDCVPIKLKFRRGKVVELTKENSGPRRLRFRRGRVIGENQDTNTNFRRRKFKERGADLQTKGTNGDSGKVVLRHQDVEEKKDALGLFNNVIEETASKLVESRKSKVQALVGAFETVISLQESKPSTQTVS